LDGNTPGSIKIEGVSAVDHITENFTEGLDFLDEDLYRDETRSTGFVGQSSEVQWLRAIAVAQADTTDGDWVGLAPQHRDSDAPASEPVNSVSFWTDCDGVIIDFEVDPYELPQPDIAEHLVQCYMIKVHGKHPHVRTICETHTYFLHNSESFPILPRRAFEDQIRMYFTAIRNGNAPRLDPKWQTVLNLVFAIGANYSHLLDSRWRVEDHTKYEARARAFGLNEDAFISHPDIPQIRSLGLLAFYWLSVGQVSR
jgi:hypothetical protein